MIMSIQDLAQALFTKCMQVVLRDNVHRKLARSNQKYMEYLQLALETYVAVYVLDACPVPP